MTGMLAGFLNSLTGDSQETVENVFRLITAQSGSPNDLAQLASYLKSREAWFSRNKASLPEHLAALDPEQHSLGYLYVLTAIASQSGQNEGLISYAISFVNSCSPEQIRLAPEKFIHFAGLVKDKLAVQHRYKAAVLLLSTAIQKVSPGQEYITALHADCFYMCLISKSYSAALPLLDAQPANVDPSKTALTARSFLLYCYYGAMLHIGRKRYADALRLLLYAITAPTFVVNAITMAAHKKYVLVSLIHTGSLPPLPRFTPSSVSRSVKGENGPYFDLEKAFKEDGNWNRVSEQHRAVLTQDGNWGLVQLAGESRVMRRIQRLTQTYLTLSLADIARTANLHGPQQAQHCILRMIDAGDIFAQIDEQAGMVRFLEDPQQYSSADMAAHLDAQVQRAQALAGKLKTLDHEVSCEKTYLGKGGGGKERYPRGGGVEEGEFASAAEFNLPTIQSSSLAEAQHMP